MKKKLTKSNTNIVVTGTLGGIAEYFNIDATIVRVIYVLLTFFAIGSPILLYFVLMLIIPSANRNQSYQAPYNRHFTNGNQKQERPIKEAEKVDEDDWSDF